MHLERCTGEVCGAAAEGSGGLEDPLPGAPCARMEEEVTEAAAEWDAAVRAGGIVELASAGFRVYSGVSRSVEGVLGWRFSEGSP